jgi:hypothetical protein
MRRRWIALTLGLASLCACSGDSGSTEPPANWAAITLISGANQTVTVRPTLRTYLPQPLVVRVDSLGRPKAGAIVSVSVTMNGEPKQQPMFSFLTDTDGIARMQVQLGSNPGPVSIVAEYVKCKTTGFACGEWVTFASVSVPGITAQ